MLYASREIEDLAAANEEQAAIVTEVEGSVSLLSGEEAETDGGMKSESSEEVSIPQDLPDGMPVVIKMHCAEQLREVALGNIDPDDLM